MAIIVDDFQRADGSLGANWTAITGLTAPTISSNAAANTSTAYHGAIYTGSAFGNDQSAQVKIGTVSSSSVYFVFVRISGSAFSGYAAFANGNASYVIRRYDAGAGTNLQSLAQAPVTGDILKLRVIGQMLYLYVNGVMVNSANDSIYTSGSPGMGMQINSGTITVDDFIADTADTAPYYCVDVVYGASGNDGIGWYKAAFTSGSYKSGTAPPAIGDTLTGATSTKTAVIHKIAHTSGSWQAGDAAGNFYVCTPSGAFTPGEGLTIGGTDVATLTADFARATKDKLDNVSAAMLAGGFGIRYSKSPEPVAVTDSHADWTNDSATVTLQTAMTANIDRCEAVSTSPSNNRWKSNITNVTGTTGTAQKEGSYYVNFAIAAGFTTGQVTYCPIASTDFSTYQQFSFWILVTGADVAANTFRIDLCSDTVGATPVDSFTIPILLESDRWYPLSYNKGSALGSTIQSVNIQALLDPGAISVRIDNIFAHNGLNLQSLIGKNTAGETFWSIKSINGTTVILGESQQTASSVTKYYGTTEHCNTYYRNPFTPQSGVAAERYATNLALATATTTAIQTLQDSGDSNSLITMSGGWNPADNTQSGETWLDGLVGWGYGMYSNTKGWHSIDKMNFVRYYTSIYCNSVYRSKVVSCASVGASSQGIRIDLGCDVDIESVIVVQNNATSSSAIQCASNCKVVSPIVKSCGIALLLLQGTTRVFNPVFEGNSYDVWVSNSGNIFLYNPTFGTYSTTPIFTNTNYSSQASEQSRMLIDKYNGIAGDHRFYGFYTYNLSTFYYSKLDSAIYKTAAPSIRLTPNSSIYRALSAPLDLGMKVPVSSGQAVTISCYVRFSESGDGAAFNGTTNLPRLIVRRNDLVGITSDTVIDTHSGGSGWEQLTGATSAASADGVMEFFVDCTGTAGWINIDDWSFTAA